jgi:hypothetical protein
MMQQRTETGASNAWYAQPILWLGVAVFVLSMAGCVWIIVASLRYDETPHHGHSQVILGVPASARSSPPPTR